MRRRLGGDSEREKSLSVDRASCKGGNTFLSSAPGDGRTLGKPNRPGFLGMTGKITAPGPDLCTPALSWAAGLGPLRPSYRPPLRPSSAAHTVGAPESCTACMRGLSEKWDVWLRVSVKLSPGDCPPHPGLSPPQAPTPPATATTSPPLPPPPTQGRNPGSVSPEASPNDRFHRGEDSLSSPLLPVKSPYK